MIKLYAQIESPTPPGYVPAKLLKTDMWLSGKTHHLISLGGASTVRCSRNIDIQQS